MNLAPAIVWFRSDLRITDNPALVEAIESKKGLICLFIYEPKEHGYWELGEASRYWLGMSLLVLQEEIKKIGGKLLIREGDSATILLKLFSETGADSIYYNHLYEPALMKRDAKIKSALENKGIAVHAFHGNLLYDPKDILALHGKPYQAFTAFKNAVVKHFTVAKPLAAPTKITSFRKALSSLPINKTSLAIKTPTVKKLGKYWVSGTRAAHAVLAKFVQMKANSYSKKRDFPSFEGTSHLSPYLHFGEISPREVLHAAKKYGAFLNEILWREFAHHTLIAFPYTTTESMKTEFRKFPWNKNAKAMKAWQEGKTGYPFIDAGMRELQNTGWMHNRARMAVASFLVKDLFIPWKDGAKWFWDHLVDADLANNSLNWQWCAGCGVDAAPFFRIFNPILQGKKFDPEGKYIKKFVPELKNLPAKYIHAPWEAPEEVLKKAKIQIGSDYPMPICDHEETRKKALKIFHKLKKSAPFSEESKLRSDLLFLKKAALKTDLGRPRWRNRS